MTSQRFRSEKGKRGSNCTGSEGSNRTYTLANTGVINSSTAIYFGGAYLYEETDYTIVGQVITFVISVYDDSYLDFFYFTQDTSTSDSDHYATPLDIVRITGIGTEIFDENVGTGTGSLASFDLDNGNVIDNSYTLRYGASGSNSLTDLTETTHYNIDLDAGRILLTAAGMTAVSTNILYASYVFTPKMSNTQIESYQESSDREVDGLTGAYWGTPIADTQFFDGTASFTYPTTDEPYARDYDEPDELQLKRRNIQSLDGVYFLQKGAQLGKVQSYDDSAAAYTDRTSSANTPGETGFAPFATVTGVNDYLYIGAAYKFHGLQITLFTLGSTTGTNTIEYWNGTAWTAFTATQSVDDVLNFEATGKLTWTALASWTKNSVNSSDSLYHVRVKAAAVYATEPIINSLAMTQDFVISMQVPPYSLDWNEEGRIILQNNRIPNGSRNVRVDYQHGQSAVPAMVTELSALLSGLRIFASITGGSYDDATHYALGRKEVTIGETYTNVREVVNQIRERINELVPNLGRRFAFAAV